MDSSTLLELQLTEQLLNSTLFDGRAAKELLSKDEAGAIFIRRVVAMLTSSGGRYWRSRKTDCVCGTGICREQRAEW